MALKHPPEGEPEDEDQAPELDETLTGMDYIPYTPAERGRILQQLEQWNDEDEFLRCIQALNTVPEDWHSYRIAYAMARALENYAVLGDHQQEPPYYKAEKALLRAIEMLESVRVEGQDKAEWNMRMAYGYQYLYGQEEKSHPLRPAVGGAGPGGRGRPGGDSSVSGGDCKASRGRSRG